MKTLFFYSVLIVSIAFTYYLMFQIGHSYGAQDQIIKSLTRDYIEIGYTPEIAKHLVDVELGIIPEDTLYTSIKED